MNVFNSQLMFRSSYSSHLSADLLAPQNELKDDGGKEIYVSAIKTCVGRCHCNLENDNKINVHGLVFSLTK
jgi:hypothetical protein